MMGARIKNRTAFLCSKERSTEAGILLLERLQTICNWSSTDTEEKRVLAIKRRRLGLKKGESYAWTFFGFNFHPVPRLPSGSQRMPPLLLDSTHQAC
jgi:hypothetical protein